jgi:hypothetical protein
MRADCVYTAPLCGAAPVKMAQGAGTQFWWSDNATQEAHEPAQLRVRMPHLVQSDSHERQRSLAAAYLRVTAGISIDLCACQARTLVAPPLSCRP